MVVVVVVANDTTFCTIASTFATVMAIVVVVYPFLTY